MTVELDQFIPREEFRFKCKLARGKIADLLHEGILVLQAHLPEEGIEFPDCCERLSRGFEFPRERSPFPGNLHGIELFQNGFLFVPPWNARSIDEAGGNEDSRRNAVTLEDRKRVNEIVAIPVVEGNNDSSVRKRACRQPLDGVRESDTIIILTYILNLLLEFCYWKSNAHGWIVGLREFRISGYTMIEKATSNARIETVENPK